MSDQGPPYTSAAPKIFSSLSDNGERLNRVIARLMDEAEKLYDIMEIARFCEDGANEHRQARKRYDEIAKELEEWRAVAAKEKRKREEEKAAADKKRAAEAEKAEAEKRRAAEADKKRATEKAATEKRREEELEKQKDEQLRALRAQFDAERKARIQAEEWVAAELKKHQERVRKADEEVKSLQVEIAKTKRHADLLANYDRIRAVEQARKELDDAKRRLQREHDEFRKKSYEAFQAQQRELQKATEEAKRRAAQKQKEMSDAGKEAERQAYSVQRPKEVAFDSPRNQTYEHRPASQYHHEPGQHRVKHAEKDSHHYNSHQDSYNYFRSQNPHHIEKPTYRQGVQQSNESSTHAHSRHHQNVDYPPILNPSPQGHQAMVGLSGMPAGSAIDSYSPAVAPWEEKNQNWSTPQRPTWQGPALELRALEQELDASPVLVHRSGLSTTAKEQWPLPPTPIPSPKVDAYTLQETEEEKLRREVAEYKAKCAKMAADLERKKRVSGADSVATWQTGTKSIWEDPTKDTRKDNYGSGHQVHQSEASKSQAANSSSSRNNERDGSSGEPSKPTISVQNLHRRQPSVQHKTKRPESRASTDTRYFEAAEYASSNKYGTPNPELSNRDTQHAWQKASGERYPSCVPPTPHRHQSPPPVLPPTPPRGSQVSTPATDRSNPKQQVPFRHEVQTLKLTGLPGSWRDEQQLPAQDPREKHWPANVSTPSVPSPAVPAHEPYEINQPNGYVTAPEDVPPPVSYVSAANTHVRKSSYNYQVPFNYPSHPSTHGIAIPVRRPITGAPSVPAAYPAYHPSYASYNGKARVGPSGHNGDGGLSSFPSWGDKTAAQSLGGTGVQQAPRKEDKGKERA